MKVGGSDSHRGLQRWAVVIIVKVYKGGHSEQ